MPQTSPKITKKPQDHYLNQNIALSEEVVSLQENLNKLVIELRSGYKS